jgi:hypothetical protein
VLASGLELLDPATPGGRRVRETLEFYRFVRADLQAMVERWREHRRRLLVAGGTNP